MNKIIQFPIASILHKERKKKSYGYFLARVWIIGNATKYMFNTSFSLEAVPDKRTPWTDPLYLPGSPSTSRGGGEKNNGKTWLIIIRLSVIMKGVIYLV